MSSSQLRPDTNRGLACAKQPAFEHCARKPSALACAHCIRFTCCFIHFERPKPNPNPNPNPGEDIPEWFAFKSVVEVLRANV